MKRRLPFFTLLLLFIGSNGALASVDWQSRLLLPGKGSVMATVASFDGQKLFVLTRGHLTLYDGKGNKIGSTTVPEEMNQLQITGFQPAGIPEKIFVSSTSTGQVIQLDYSMVIPIDAAGSPFLGNPEAPVTIAIFSDFQ